MSKNILYGSVAAVGLALLGGSAGSTRVQASQHDVAYVPPIVFQAAGPTVASIQSMVDAFRAALGANNGSVTGPLTDGRREINWDGGGSTATTISRTPFDGFLLIRGARFETPGQAFVQAPTSGIAGTFDNRSYAEIFTPFSPVRLFSAVESNLTDAKFFIPGGGELRATTKGFGAIFTDVDHDGGKHGKKDRASTKIWYYGVDGKVIYKADVPASPGNGSLSFLGVLFPKADVARVRIQSGNVKPGVDDGGRYDVVMMDDFIFGEPQAVPADKVHDIDDDDRDDDKDDDRDDKSTK